MDFGKYIAHRGVQSRGVPENSLPAIKAAADLGFAAELDVRLTKDCKIIVFHDDNLKRMCGVDAKVSDFTYEQLQALYLSESDEKIPLFSDVLKAVNGKAPLLIELKKCAPYGTLEKRVSRLLSKYKGEYAVQSFDPFSLLWFRIHAPKVLRCQLVSAFKNKFDLEYLGRKIAASPLIWKLISKPDFIAADLRSITMEQIFSVIDSGADLLTWTTTSPELLEAAEQFSKTVIADSGALDFYTVSDNWEE